MRGRRWNAALWAVTAAAVLLLLAKFFVADVYRVDSGSMRPTLFGGRERPDGEDESERVLVRYGQDAPARFDLVVIRSPDGQESLVKRVCGLPGEELMIRGGDLFVGRERLPADAPRPAPIPVYDDRGNDPLELFEHRRDGTVRREGDAWVVDGDAHPPGNLLLFHPELRDDYLDRAGRRVPGVVEVNDARVELELSLDALGAAQTVRVQLTEEGDLFELELSVEPGGAAVARLLRLNRRLLRMLEPGGESAERELARSGPLALEAGRSYDLALSNVDDVLRVRSRALALDLAHAYAGNEPLLQPSEGPALPGAPRNLGSRVRFGVQGGRARFRAVRVLRDLYYTADGSYGVPRRPAGSGGEPPASGDSVSLGPDDYFLLGDNSAASTDSRHFGPVKRSQLLGRPLAVVWPEPRWLEPVEPE